MQENEDDEKAAALTDALFAFLHEQNAEASTAIKAMLGTIICVSVFLKIDKAILRTSFDEALDHYDRGEEIAQQMDLERGTKRRGSK